MLHLEEAGVEAKRGDVIFDRDVSFVAGILATRAGGV